MAAAREPFRFRVPDPWQITLAIGRGRMSRSDRRLAAAVLLQMLDRPTETPDVDQFIAMAEEYVSGINDSQ